MLIVVTISKHFIISYFHQFFLHIASLKMSQAVWLIIESASHFIKYCCARLVARPADLKHLKPGTWIQPATHFSFKACGHSDLDIMSMCCAPPCRHRPPLTLLLDMNAL